METTAILQAEQSRLQAELSAARADSTKELRHLLLMFGIFVLAVVLQLWLKPKAEFSVFVFVLLSGSFGAAFTYVAIRALLAWNEMRSLNRQLRNIASLSADVFGS